MRQRGIAWIGLALAAAAAGASPQGPEATAAPVAGGGLVAVVPGEAARTDELLAELHADPALREAFRTDAAGLVEERSPDGGVSVHLRGRFQHVLVARLGADGRLVASHAPAPPPAPVAAAEAAGPACTAATPTAPGGRP
jgi:hypothetical protein